MCGCTGNCSLARAPIRPNSAWKALGVIGPSRSVIKTCEDGPCSRCRRRSARISSPCIGWTLGEPFFAGRLCGADYATISRQKDGVLFFAEAYGYSSDFIEYVKAMPVERGRGTATGRALLEGRVIHIADVLADPDYTWAEAQRLGGYRTVLAVPMMREDAPTGVLTLTRSEVRPFSDKQIELVSTFADEAAT